MRTIKEKFMSMPDFSPDETFDCGQCFRFERLPDGAFTGVAYGRVIKIRQCEDGVVFCYDGDDDFDKLWYDYFDLGTDYGAIKRTLESDPVMRQAIGFGGGIRILRQEPFETLISFIISQNCNIPRIKGIIRALCSQFGEKVDFDGEVHYAFPTARRMAQLSIDDIAAIKTGFRAKYIFDAVQKVSSGEISLESLGELPYLQAKEQLLRIKGVGEKVANCVLLFGYHMVEAFPIDVWIKNAIGKYYGPEFDTGIFGGYPGIAQQYLFYFARERKIAPL